jgi:pimeloyl-ACP methyl ester carboxylesterase
MSTIQKSLIAAKVLILVACQALAQEGNATMEQKIIKNGALGLQVYQDGREDAVPLVFLHGDSGAAAQWFSVMALLSQSYRTLAFDQRGHGASSTAKEGAYGYPARANDLHTVILNSGLGAVVLVAHSGAAGLALEYARTHPERVSGIFLLDPATDPSAMPDDMRAEFRTAIRSENVLGLVQGYYTSIAGQNPETIATVVADVARTAPGAMVGVAETLLDWDPQAAMAAWEGPLKMVMTPANDNPASLRHFDKNMAFELLTAEGHWPHLDNPTMISESINAFMVELD